MEHERTIKHIGFFLIAVVGMTLVYLALQSPKETAATQPAPQATAPSAAQLGIHVVRAGEGAAAVRGNIVAVHYRGTLSDGTEFDSSHSRGAPIVFRLGEGRVIQGWELGILDMQVGEIRELVIPPDLAYGSRGAPPKIPPDATLHFTVELMGIQE